MAVSGAFDYAQAKQGTLPKPAGRITDLANVIDAGTESELDRRLDDLEQKTSHEIAVVTVTSLGGTTVDDYAVRLFKEWGIGQAKQDNGVLVLVAPNEREMRIEVGYGLEGILPDGLAGEIIRDNFIPRFRNNDYNGGIRDGVLRVADIVEKQQVLTPEELARFNQSNSGDEMPMWALIPFLGIFVTIGFGMMGVGVRTKTAFPLLFGSLFGGMPMLMSLIAGLLGFSVLLAWAIFMFIIGYRLGGRQSWRDSFRGTKGAAVFTVAISMTCSVPDVLEITTEEGKSVRFERTTSGSYGPRATNVIVGEADGLEPRVASCTAVAPANFHRDAPLGHHFQPELIDLKEALSRTREIVEEVSYWPRCPMSWDVQDKRGVNYRYCARKKGETVEPPRPDDCGRD